MLNRDETDNFFVNQEKPDHVHEYVKGIPITLKVITHLDARILETYYLQKTESGLKEVKFNRRNLSVNLKPIQTEKVFTVDFKSPGGGSLNYGADFDGQYFSKIQATYVDETLKDLAYAFKKPVFQGLFARSTAFGDLNETSGDKTKEKLIEAVRHVAYERFDINAPDFEERLLGFMQHHLNDCHDCKNTAVSKQEIIADLEWDPVNITTPHP